MSWLGLINLYYKMNVYFEIDYLNIENVSY